VNIGVNLHYTKDGVLEGTLNETMPENQTCTDPVFGTFAVGPSHFTSKPSPPTGCLYVNSANQAAVITTVTQVSGLETFDGSGVSRGFNVRVDQPIHSSFLDNLNSPSQQSTDPRDMLNAPPAPDESECVSRDTGNPGTQHNVLQNGNINVYPRS
jgi:hypothetical protein